MYKPKVFLVGEGEDNLIPLEETDYVREEILQELLVKYPDLLPGDQIDPENPRRWLLVAREMGVPGEENAPDRWSLDHLFLDQEGIPTFVECKRASDTRSRREVVAQMLDYAANGTEYWSIERMRQAAAEMSAKRQATLDDDITDLLGQDDADVEDYWNQVENNLRSHRIRLLFVADRIPRELRRLVEFLNEEMGNVEVLAVEVKQYQRPDGKEHKALVPRVLGMTETARSTKQTAAARNRKTTREGFLDACTAEAIGFFERVLDLAQQKGHTIYWGSLGFSLRAHKPMGNREYSFGYGMPPDEFQIYLQSNWLRAEPRASTLRKQLLDFGVFREAGKWTLKAEVIEENIPSLEEAYDLILQLMDEFRQDDQ